MPAGADLCPFQRHQCNINTAAFPDGFSPTLGVFYDGLRPFYGSSRVPPHPGIQMNNRPDFWPQRRWSCKSCILFDRDRRHCCPPLKLRTAPAQLAAQPSGNKRSIHSRAGWLTSGILCPLVNIICFHYHNSRINWWSGFLSA